MRERALCAWLDVPVGGRLGARWTARRAPRPLAGDGRRSSSCTTSAGRCTAAAADAIVAGEESAGGGRGRDRAAGLDAPGHRRDARWARAPSRSSTARSTLARAGAIELEGGEEAKSLATLERLWRALAERELERGDVVVCAGGGSVTDVGGFAAATFRRGVPWLAVPSTLVGQVDAAIGGKTAINVAAKNDVGAFWQPKAVLCDPALLETLPPREWAGGMAEVVKTGAARGRTAVGARRGLGAGHRRASPRAASSCSAARA